MTDNQEIMRDQMKYMVCLKGKIEGPFTLAVLRAKILDGSVPEDSEVQQIGEPTWRPTREIFDRLFPSWR